MKVAGMFWAPGKVELAGGFCCGPANGGKGLVRAPDPRRRGSSSTGCQKGWRRRAGTVRWREGSDIADHLVESIFHRGGKESKGGANRGRGTGVQARPSTRFEVAVAGLVELIVNARVSGKDQAARRVGKARALLAGHVVRAAPARHVRRCVGVPAQAECHGQVGLDLVLILPVEAPHPLRGGVLFARCLGDALRLAKQEVGER